ncbi:MAG: DUF3780 domain-containing protein [Betaproteobacteria bacterium]|nr:DUF3780 domain-containing protein [Betaproteobacteria bacterium]
MPASRSTRPVTQEAPVGFGFNPDESTHHFLVTIPAGNRQEVLISEHYRWDAASGSGTITFADGVDDGKLRVSLDRGKWNAIADEVRVEFNRRLKRQGLSAGIWKTGGNPLSRLLGKELVLLAWAVEDADPVLIPTAMRNWAGLAPEERWWLYTMTNAATGHAVHGRGKGWRKAVRFALTENPVGHAHHEPPPHVFRLLAESDRDDMPSLTVPKATRRTRKTVRS